MRDVAAPPHGERRRDRIATALTRALAMRDLPVGGGALGIALVRFLQAAGCHRKPAGACFGDKLSTT
jgi:hypothetical protein